jgi:hypothetical protein
LALRPQCAVMAAEAVLDDGRRVVTGLQHLWVHRFACLQLLFAAVSSGIAEL